MFLSNKWVQTGILKKKLTRVGGEKLYEVTNIAFTAHSHTRLQNCMFKFTT